MSNRLDPELDRCSVGPDLGPNCLQRLSADDKSHRLQGKSYVDEFSALRPNKKICVFPITGLKILGGVGIHIFLKLFFFWKKT